jgi:4-hydroxy-tetrahydrodipicolinate reductase
MGAAIVRASLDRSDLEVVAAVASAGSKSLGGDIGDIAGVRTLGVRVIGDLSKELAKADVAIDFSRPELTLRALDACREAHIPIVIGTTGHGPEFDAQVAASAREIAVLVAPNTSIGVAVAQELVRIAARVLPADFDIEISEAHHQQKVDAPSGTAIALAESAARARGLDPGSVVLAGRAGQAARKSGQIGIASVRAGDIVGTHVVLFAGQGERLTVGHEATDRSIFASGAIRAALWLTGQKPGRYSMSDVLGLKTNA